MPNPERGWRKLREKVRDGDREITHDRDRERILDFSERLELLRETYGHHRHEKLLRHVVRMAEHAETPLADALEDRDAAEDVVRWIHSEYDLEATPETNQNYRVALRIFGKRLGEDDEIPDALAWIPSKLPSSYDPSPDPAEMLTWEDDVEPMLDGARNARDEAAIALAFDAGPRGGELYDLRVGDLSTTDHGLAIRVDGKTGERSVNLIPATPHVNRWLAEHPGDDDDYLWTSLTEPSRLSYNSYLDMFKRPAERAGVEKTVTPTAFRKSNLAWLCRQGMNARYIEKRQGRKHGSEAVARYAAVFDADVGDEYARIMGLEVAEDDDDASEFAPLECPQCGRETPAREDHCMWCHQTLRRSADDTTADQDRELMETIADHPELADDLLEIKAMLDDVPGLRVDFKKD